MFPKSQEDLQRVLSTQECVGKAYRIWARKVNIEKVQNTATSNDWSHLLSTPRDLAHCLGNNLSFSKPDTKHDV